MWIYAFLFANAIVLDVVWAFYIRRTSEGRYWQAGLFAACTLIFGGFSGYEIAHNAWMIIPAALGAFVGTTTTVYRDAKKVKP